MNKVKSLLTSVAAGFILITGLHSVSVYASSEVPASNAGDAKITETAGTGNIDSILKDGRYTLLLLGIDGPHDEGQRSDTVMIAEFNKDTKEIRIISMPRDSYVDIPGEGFDKLTHAFAYGGAELTVETLNNNLGLGIEGYMTLNFKTFPQFIDALGGVEINLSEGEAETVKKGPGKVLLNGADALTFARIRAIDSDYMRTGRHRRLMKAVIEKIEAMNPSELPALSESLFKTLSTDQKAGSLFTLGKYAYENKFTVKDILIPDEENSWGNIIDGAWVLEFDIPEAKEKMKDFLR